MFYTVHHSAGLAGSPWLEQNITFSCLCFVSLSFHFRLNWQQLLSLLTCFYSSSSFFLLRSLSLSLSSIWPGKVFIYFHSVALFYPCCASLYQVEKSHFRHLQRHLRGSHAPSQSVFYLRFFSLSSFCFPNLLASAAFCHKTTLSSQVKRG